IRVLRAAGRRARAAGPDPPVARAATATYANFGVTGRGTKRPKRARRGRAFAERAPAVCRRRTSTTSAVGTNGSAITRPSWSETAATRRPSTSATIVEPVRARALSSSARAASSAVSAGRPRRTTRLPPAAPSRLWLAYEREAGMGGTVPARGGRGDGGGTRSSGAVVRESGCGQLHPEIRISRARPEYRQPMFDAGLVGILGVWVAAVAWRAVW